MERTAQGGTCPEGGQLGYMDCISAASNGGWAASDHGHVGEDSDGVVGGAQGRGRRPTGAASGTPRWRAAGAGGHGTSGRTTGRAPPSAGRGRGRDGERGRGPRGCGLAEYGPTYCCRRPRSLRRRGGSGCAWTRRRGRPGTLGTHVICRRDRDRRGPVSKLCAVECLCPAFLSLPSIDVHSNQNVVPPLVQQPMADRAPG